MTGSPSPNLQITPGQTVGHYAIVSTLGRGGMGEVFLARDITLDRKVALKVLSRELVNDEQHLQRFQREARSLAGLAHPNIVTLFAVEEVEGQHVLSMEYVDGATLRQLVAPGGLPVERFLEIAVALSDAVAAAHERGVTHRDLKPENVMLTASGHVKVLDFGLAKALPAARASSAEAADLLTREGVLLGTLPYMSPEQIDGREVDHRADIFALGIIFYEMLTGDRPFKGDTSARLLASILTDNPPSVLTARRDLPEELHRIVRICLQKEPGHRFQSAVDVRNQMQDLLQEMRWGSASTPARGYFRRPARIPALSSMRSLHTRAGITVLLVAVGLINWSETTIENAFKARFGLGSRLGYELASVMTWLEGGLSFERHDLSSPLAIYTASMAYFFVPLLLAAWTVAQLAWRRDVGAYRIFALAIAVTYGLSLGCYLFFPVPERWAYPESEAVLLSDLWSVRLIETFRPVSGLDNCFPSFHVASMVIVMVLWYMFRLRFRHTVALLSSAVILSTFLLGIHWLADIVAGGAVGLIGTRAGVAINGRLTRSRFRSPSDLTTISAELRS
jgi:serine/threonine protein kinase